MLFLHLCLSLCYSFVCKLVDHVLLDIQTSVLFVPCLQTFSFFFQIGGSLAKLLFNQVESCFKLELPLFFEIHFFPMPRNQIFPFNHSFLLFLFDGPIEQTDNLLMIINHLRFHILPLLTHPLLLNQVPPLLPLYRLLQLPRIILPFLLLDNPLQLFDSPHKRSFLLFDPSFVQFHHIVVLLNPFFVLFAPLSLLVVPLIMQPPDLLLVFHVQHQLLLGLVLSELSYLEVELLLDASQFFLELLAIGARHRLKVLCRVCPTCYSSAVVLNYPISITAIQCTRSLCRQETIDPLIPSPVETLQELNPHPFRAYRMVD